MSKLDFQLNYYFEKYKNKPFRNGKEFREKFIKENGKFILLNELFIMISKYQVKNNIYTIHDYAYNLPKQDYERKRWTYNKIEYERKKSERNRYEKKKIFKKNEDYFKFINANEIEIEEVRVKGDSIILFYGRKDGREINKRN